MSESRSFNQIWAFAPMLFLMITIFYFSSKTIPKTATQIPDYLLHFACYAVLCLFSYYGFSKNIPAAEQTLIILALILTTLYGISDEFHQSYVPGRDPSFSDVFSDFVGAASVGSLFWLRSRRKQTRL